MRVISGRFRGHRLVSFKSKNIRPTTDIVKEGIFNRLASMLPGSRVLDLFSGTGNLSIEALSRGAAEVVAVENHPQSLKIIVENLDRLRVKDEIQVVGDDVMRFLKRYGGPGFGIILIDPPFTQKMAHDVMVALSESRVFQEGSRVVIESSGKERMDGKYGTFELFVQKDYGDKKVSFFRSSSLPL